jgi:hypothetical protein
VPLCVAALVAPVAAGQLRPPASFNGSCEFAGVVVFDPPLTNAAHSLTQHAWARGTCSGTLVDRRGRPRQLSGAPVRYAATSRADSASCLTGMATGPGVLAFPGARIRFTLSETRATALGVLHLAGRAGGEADGETSPATSENPAGAVQQCAGSGIERIAIQFRIQTFPSISG